MKKAALAVLAGVMLSGPALSQHWSYEGESASENWGKLDPSFIMCGIGKNQPPINLDRLIGAQLKPLKLNYATGVAGHAPLVGATEILNNGHTVQVNYTPGSTIIVDGRAFEMKQFHFHSPSENRIDGKQFPLEAHLVHADATGNLVVLAIMFEEGASNTFLAKIWDRLPANKGDESKLQAGLNAEQMLPASKGYYYFNGSLTTPPCTEGVRWLVMKSPVTVSKAQVDRFAKAVGHPNNRPVQPVNARILLK
jgi:carbonic anhydrase